MHILEIAGTKNSFKNSDDVKKKVALRKGVREQNLNFF